MSTQNPRYGPTFSASAIFARPKEAKSGKPSGLPLLGEKPLNDSFENYLPDLAGAEAGAVFCSTECEPFDRT
jgi:hypothetical protein